MVHFQNDSVLPRGVWRSIHLREVLLICWESSDYFWYSVDSLIDSMKEHYKNRINKRPQLNIS